jgi:hypothetical protein
MIKLILYLHLQSENTIILITYFLIIELLHIYNISKTINLKLFMNSLYN